VGQRRLATARIFELRLQFPDAGQQLVDDPQSLTTDLCLVDAADIAAPAMSTARFVRPIPLDLDCTWIPSIPSV